MRRGGYLLSLAVLAFTTSARGEIGALDVVPAATLLLPYFEVAIDDGEFGVHTEFTIRNANAAPVIAHVMLFTDFGVGTLPFDVYLTGFDVERINLYDILALNSRALPQDSPVVTPGPQAPTETSLFDDGFETGDLSGWTSYVSDVSLETVRAYHQGTLAPREGNCGGQSLGDGVLRGYVLIDSVSTPGADFPDAPGYFVSGGLGVANNENVLTGEFEIFDSAENFSFGNAMLHLEASSVDSNTSAPGKYTFYARYVNSTAADNREPLATQWANRYYLGGVFDETDYVYWRDSKVIQGPVVCGAGPTWYPLYTSAATFFDEEENSVAYGAIPAFPAVCGRVSVGGSNLPTPFSFGWSRIEFNNVSTGILSNLCQGFILHSQQASGRFQLGAPGLALDSGSDY